ncbi:hypothetical protein [Azospirillum sp. TSO35-2]|uniref:hypothetical protein n=1 Tax=Azospirillum sp. TSO35-2 TaxID=716796 RepID=UPI000D60F2BE|nr:hypothetical protein [Azospirillum sp. TSO35-2]PWC35973.1 hypothetical protein TSO352_12330 [Azospirillum sp. TSO35-2]
MPTTLEHPLPSRVQALPLAAIEGATTEAGARRGWRFRRIEDGQVRASCFKRWPWYVETDVIFSGESDRTVLVTAKTMEKRDDGVERAYNRWVTNLDEDIQAKLAELSVRRN